MRGSKLCWRGWRGIDGDSFEPTLRVRSADTGALLYPVAIASLFVAVPVLDRDPGTQGLVAYLSSPEKFDAPGALAPGAFLLDYGRIDDRPGFSVFVPEPAAWLQAAFAALGLAARARRRPRRSGS